jgi:hypothetical protein
MNWLHFITKLHAWRHGRQVFRIAFWTSLIFTLDLVVTNSSALANWLKIDSIPKAALGVLICIGLAGIFGAVLLWIGMLVHCMSGPRSILFRSVWLVLFLFGFCWTAEVYYLALYRSQSGNAKQTNQTSPVAS